MLDDTRRPFYFLGLSKENPAVKIIVLTMYSNEELAVRLFKAGASGFIPKFLSGKTLPSAIRSVVGGATYIPDEIRDAVTARLISPEKSGVAHLSDRELQVFKALAEDRSVNDIADMMGISPRTVETYKSRVMSKMNLASIIDLYRAAVRHGLIQEK